MSVLNTFFADLANGLSYATRPVAAVDLSTRVKQAVAYPLDLIVEAAVKPKARR